MGDIVDSIGSLGDSIVSGIAEGFGIIIEPIKTGITSIIDFIKSILEAILSIPQKLIDLLIETLKALFIPSEGYFTEKLDKLAQRFSFIDSMVATVRVFTNFFSNNDFTKPPTITVNLSSGTGKVNYGMNAKAIDFSWYAPFKDTVDVLLSSILYVVFAWNTFKDIPSILGGVSSGVSSTAQLDNAINKED